MSETSTETRSDTQMALRIIADLHAAYGKGVDMDISGQTSAYDAQIWVTLCPSEVRYPMGATLAIGFWANGEVWSNEHVATSTTTVGAVEMARTFFHQHGYGPR